MSNLIINFHDSSIGEIVDLEGVGSFFNGRVIGDFPPWPSGADLLVSESPTKRLWVGITYQVQPNFREQIKALVQSLDSKFVVYDATSAKQSFPPYTDESEEIHFLEIRWSETRANVSLFAQLVLDTWLYSLDEYRTPLGICLHSTYKTEEEFSVTLDRSLIRNRSSSD